MPKPIYYPAYAIRVEIQWSQGQPGQVVTIPSNAWDYMIDAGNNNWMAVNMDDLRVYTPGNQPAPVFNLIAYVTFPAITPTPPALTATITSQNGKKPKSNQRNSPFSPNPLTLAMTYATSGDQITYQASCGTNYVNQGDFEVSVSISGLNSSNQTLTFQLDPEMEVSGDG
jgi:hypothetical protein